MFKKCESAINTYVSVLSLCFSSLMMCGVLAATFEHYEEAQTFLERATNIDPPSVVAWTLLGKVEVCVPAHWSLTCEPAANREDIETATIDPLLLNISLPTV